MSILRPILGGGQASSALPDGATAVTQPNTDKSNKIATTEFAWNLPAWQHLPDNTAVGGNARGANAVDWQSQRSAASQVASGLASVIGGGIGNTANSRVAWVPGGERASTRGIHGKGAWASGAFSADGDAQAGEHVLRRVTTDSGQVVLTSDGGAAGFANIVNLPPNGSALVTVMVIARQIGGAAGAIGDSACWERRQLYKRLGSGQALQVNNNGGKLFGDASTAAWALSFGVDGPNFGLTLIVQGEADKTILWVARVLSVEVIG